MKPRNVVYFGGHLIAESRIGKIENDVVRSVKKNYKEYSITQFETNLIRTAASRAITEMTRLANDLENKNPVNENS